MSEMNPAEHEQSLLPPAPPQSAGGPPPWTPLPPPPAPHDDSVWNKVAAFLVLIAVVAAAAGVGIGWSLARIVTKQPVAQSTGQPLTPITQATPGASPATGSNSAEKIAARVRPAIVDINTTLGNGQAAGTGMLISSTGEILTNNHVVTGSTSITVTVQGSSTDYTAHVIGVNVSQDVAVIQIDQSVSGLPTVKFADSSSVQVGDPVVALGNALGRGGAPATSGSVTAVDQTITASEGRADAETLSGLIQSDARIYEGDSGGALVNASGQVIGMITAGETQGFRSAASDVGYAISANTAIGVVNRIVAHDQSADLTYGQVGYLGVSVQDSASGGALVVGVQSGSPAASAGITAGSVITAIDGTAVSSSDTLRNAIKSHRPGDSVAIRWTASGGAAHTATVTLGAVNP
jgi:S1-C subfamily serine protease